MALRSEKKKWWSMSSLCIFLNFSLSCRNIQWRVNFRAPGSHAAEQIWLTGIALMVSYSTGVWSVPLNYTNYYCILHEREEGRGSTELFLVINVGMQWEGTRERLVHNYCSVSSSANPLHHPNRYPTNRARKQHKPQKWLNTEKLLN